jgi:hypothetical protein
MFREQLLVDPWFVMAALQVRGRKQFYQVAVSVILLRLQGEMKGRIGPTKRSSIIEPEPDFATDNGLDTGLWRSLLNSIAHTCSVISHRHSRHMFSALLANGTG